MKKLICILWLAAILPFLASGQIALDRDMISNAGRSTAAGPLEISWTLGGMAPGYYTSAGLILSAGFQQPDAFPVTGIQTAGLTADISAWPNPAGDVIHFAVHDPGNPTLLLGLYSPEGRKLLERTVVVSGATFSDNLALGQLPSGIYLLLFTDRATGAAHACRIVKME